MTNSIVNELKIENFKSIKSLTLTPKRINLFIGKPNTGKSNILEALSLFSVPTLTEMGDFVRHEKPSHLFCDQNLKQHVSVSAGNFSMEISARKPVHNPITTLDDFGNPIRIRSHVALWVNEKNEIEGGEEDITSLKEYNTKFKKYEFRKGVNDNAQKHLSHLQVPFGENIFYMLETHPELFEEVARFFTQYGLDLVLNQENDTMLMQKKIGNRVFQLPYSLVADTLQRMIFYLAAIKTNKESVLIFEEPETHSFPLYIQRLALEITNSIENQFFIATHSPYLFNTILEKAPKEHVAVFITYFENHETKVMLLSEEDKSEVMNYGMDVFFHLDEFITEKQLQ